VELVQRWLDCAAPAVAMQSVTVSPWPFAVGVGEGEAAGGCAVGVKATQAVAEPMLACSQTLSMTHLCMLGFNVVHPRIK
jgi:hypothetical protein